MAFLKKIGKIKKVASALGGVSDLLPDAVSDLLPDAVNDLVDNIDADTDVGLEDIKDKVLSSDTYDDFKENITRGEGVEKIKKRLTDKESINDLKDNLISLAKKKRFFGKHDSVDDSIENSLSSSLEPEQELFVAAQQREIYASIDNEQHGPYDEIQFKRLIENHLIDASTLVWQDGMPDWQPAGQAVPEFFNLATVPPIPPIPPIPPHMPGVDFLTTNHIDIPEGVNCLDEDFEIDENVTSITLPSTLKKLDSEVFCEKTKLRIIDFSKVTKLKTIPEYCFMGCSSLEEIVIPEGVLEIEYDAFEGCSSLRKIVLPSTLQDMSQLADKGLIANKGLKNLKIIDFSKVYQLRTIPEYCFDGCNNLEEIVIPEGVMEIEYDAFEGCSSLRKIVLPSTLQNMSQLADKGLKNLKIIDFSKVCQLRTIPEYCFAGCNNLEEIVIPEGVMEVEEEAFDDCKKLKRIVVPSTLNNVQNIPANLIVYKKC